MDQPRLLPNLLLIARFVFSINAETNLYVVQHVKDRL